MLGQQGSAGGKTMEQQAKKKKKLTGCSFRGHERSSDGLSLIREPSPLPCWA
jgi:hypothetical protein